ncbi:hypothetical protein CY34DRAFT_18017 [Suillus luteus UH-Slu-Lm8-n1]|uniref:Unplaced genomic scaffold CY34scaffold_696, whole genome shotgun sequence n=1 Tax=Suillus luteus UH-Slu-Lm8-n1 TaxID=930992 RepID=A0A0D0A7B1_9AGAM|nr:hypothetical protein CY34DRAFT_18017 [Suillus luteus UH-Slu-Lm8-n1]
MSIHGVIQNVKWPELFLTETNSGNVDGETFGKCENQRWIGEYSYDQQKRINLVALQNKFTGDYLAWDDHMNVVMKSSKYWWKVVFVEGNVGFQVPEEASANARIFFTLELEADRSVILKAHEGEPNHAQLWKTLHK